MNVNELPRYDGSVNTTGCCPRFNPDGWDGQELHFRDKLFVRATTHSLAHVPVDMGRVFSRVQQHIDAAAAMKNDRFLVLSHEDSAWKATHYFAVDKDVPGEETTTLSGDFITRVFEGPYSETSRWAGELEQAVRDRGKVAGDLYFFFTTCPKCAEAYGRNYVVGVAEAREPPAQPGN